VVSTRVVRGLPKPKATDTLPDLLRPNLNVVFSGVAAGTVSATRKAYYAHPQNRFWSILHESGLTSRQLCPEEYPLLLGFGIGLTDLAKSAVGMDNSVPDSRLDVGSFRRRIAEYQPLIVAFNGKRAAGAFASRDVDHGVMSECIGPTILFCLPSTSPAASRWWDERHWVELTKLVEGLTNKL